MTTSLIALLILIFVVALVAGLVVFLIRSAPFIASPFKQWMEWLVYAIAVLIILVRVLPLIGVSVG